MTVTLLICGTAIAFTALCAVAKTIDAEGRILIDDKSQLPLSDPSVETLVGTSGPPNPLAGDWHVATVETLRDAEDFLDALEAQGVEQRELLILGNSTFAIRWH
ncbi:MAG TPA: hypothetical protein VLM40_01845 [Gemmata sp.]|nr:hypothetical protein [Gemmata sp.]